MTSNDKRRPLRAGLELRVHAEVSEQRLDKKAPSEYGRAIISASVTSRLYR